MQSLARIKALKSEVGPVGIRLNGWAGLVRIMVVVSLVAVLVGPVKITSASSAGIASVSALRVPLHSGFKAPLAAGGADGTVDPTFKSGSGPNNTVNAVAVQSDGKILIGGRFITFDNSNANYLTRLNADGTFDTTFNSGGAGANGQVNAVVVQSNGKILIGGQFTTYNGTPANRITRLNTDGTFDTAFNPAGSGANGTIQVISVQSDGKILIGGSFTTYNGTGAKSITRLNADGTLDTTFNPAGSGANSAVWAIVVQSDGKILIGGFFSTYNGTTVKCITRLNADGTLDTFNPAGAGPDGTLRAIAVQSDGKILIGGVFSTYNGTPANRITRLNTDGTLDPTFNSGGAGNTSTIYAVAVQSDGKILVGGQFTSATVNNITRLNADGTLDTTFNPAGAAANGQVNAVAVQSNGKVVIGGDFYTYNGTAANRITRFNTDGSRDATFNSGGTGASFTVNAVAAQSDGKVLIGGNFTTYNGTTVNTITRLNVDGTLDTTFNPAGSGANNTVNAIAVQSDGKILIGGGFTTYNGSTVNSITRLNTDGTLDTTFNPVGSGANSFVFAIAVQSDGKILIGGSFTSYNGTLARYLTRLNADGSRDTTFNSGGVGPSFTVNAIAVQSDGRILIGGQFTAYNSVTTVGIARLNADGTLDTAFNSGGAGANSNSTIYAVAVQSDGKVLIGGGLFTTYNGATVNNITRLNADGTLDITFNVGGAGANSVVYSVVVQGDGKILIGGSFLTYNGTTVNHITRLNADGTLDTTFNVGGAGASASVLTLAMQSDGKILIGGAFSSVNTSTRDYVARLLNTVRTASNLTLAASPNPVSFGQSVTFTATVAPVAASGTVTFTEGATTLGTGTLAGGAATFSTTSLPLGSHVISATYGGDSNYFGSSSNTVTQVVNPCDPLVVINIHDDGAASACGTFSYALVQASPGTTVTFALTPSNTITFTGSLTPTVKSGVTIDGGNGAGIVLYGNGIAGDGLRLMGQDTLINLTIRKFAGRELVTLGPGNVLKHVVIKQT